MIGMLVVSPTHSHEVTAMLSPTTLHIHLSIPPLGVELALVKARWLVLMDPACFCEGLLLCHQYEIPKARLQ